MKRTQPHVLTFVLLAGFLVASTGPSARVRAADEKLIFGQVVLKPVTRPPLQICVGDTVPIAFVIESDYSMPFSLNGESNGALWLPILTIAGGRQTLPVAGTFKATQEQDDGYITISTTATSNGLHWEFTVIDCKYNVSITAAYTQRSDLVTFEVYVTGEGQMSGSSEISGQGNYSVTIRPTLEEEHADVSCKMTGELKGESIFTVTGRSDKQSLTVSLSFGEVQLGASPKLDCEDANDRLAAVTVFQNATVDPNQDMWLTEVQFPVSGGTHPFPFGGSGGGGSGTLSIFPRREK